MTHRSALSHVLSAFLWLTFFSPILIVGNPIQAAEPQIRQLAEQYSQLKSFADIAKLKAEKYEIAGQQLLPSNILSTRRLIFAANATLTIADEANKSGVIYILS